MSADEHDADATPEEIAAAERFGVKFHRKNCTMYLGLRPDLDRPPSDTGGGAFRYSDMDGESGISDALILEWVRLGRMVFSCPIKSNIEGHQRVAWFAKMLKSSPKFIGALDGR